MSAYEIESGDYAPVIDHNAIYYRATDLWGQELFDCPDGMMCVTCAAFRMREIETERDGFFISFTPEVPSERIGLWQVAKGLAAIAVGIGMSFFRRRK